MAECFLPGRTHPLLDRQSVLGPTMSAFSCATGRAVAKADIATVSRLVVVSLATLIIVRSRIVARRPSGFEEPSGNLVVRPRHAAVLTPLNLAPTSRCLADRDIE